MSNDDDTQVPSGENTDADTDAEAALQIETFDANDLTRVYPDDLPSTPRIREYTRDDPLHPVFDVEVLPLHDVVQMEVFGVARVAVPALVNAELRA